MSVIDVHKFYYSMFDSVCCYLLVFFSLDFSFLFLMANAVITRVAYALYICIFGFFVVVASVLLIILFFIFVYFSELPKIRCGHSTCASVISTVFN